MLIVFQSCNQHYFEGVLIENSSLIVKADTSLNRHQHNLLYLSDLKVKTLLSKGELREIIYDGATGYTYLFLKDGSVKMANVDTVSNSPILGTKHIDIADTILGYQCNAFVLWTSTMKKTFFYNDGVLEVNPDLLAKQKIGYIDVALKEIGVYPLKVIEETADYIIINEIIDFSESDTIKIEIPKLKR